MFSSPGRSIARVSLLMVCGEVVECPIGNRISFDTHSGESLNSSSFFCKTPSFCQDMWCDFWRRLQAKSRSSNRTSICGRWTDASSCSFDACAMHVCTRVIQSSLVVLRWARPSRSVAITKMAFSPRCWAMKAIFLKFSRA